MPALSSRHGTAFRLLRIGALLVACLVFLYGCEVSRSATLGDVPHYVIAAVLAAVVAFTAAWFEIRAVRAARRGVTLSDGRWRVVGRMGADGALLLLGHDGAPDADPDDPPAGWTWTFGPGALDAVRETVAAACFPDDDPDELYDLDVLDLLADAVPLLDPAARADPGAWLHAHGIPGEREEWGVDATVTTRTLPVVRVPRRGGARAAAGRGAVPPGQRTPASPVGGTARSRPPSADRRKTGEPARASAPAAGTEPRRPGREPRGTAAAPDGSPRAQRSRRSGRGPAESPARPARRDGVPVEPGRRRRRGDPGAPDDGDGPTTPTHRPPRRSREADGRGGHSSERAGSTAGRAGAVGSPAAESRRSESAAARAGFDTPGAGFEARRSGVIQRRGVGRHELSPEAEASGGRWRDRGIDGPTQRIRSRPELAAPELPVHDGRRIDGGQRLETWTPESPPHDERRIESHGRRRIAAPEFPADDDLIAGRRPAGADREPAPRRRRREADQPIAQRNPVPPRLSRPRRDHD